MFENNRFKISSRFFTIYSFTKKTFDNFRTFENIFVEIHRNVDEFCYKYHFKCMFYIQIKKSTQK